MYTCVDVVACCPVPPPVCSSAAVCSSASVVDPVWPVLTPLVSPTAQHHAGGPGCQSPDDHASDGAGRHHAHRPSQLPAGPAAAARVW